MASARELRKDLARYLPAQLVPAAVGFLSVPILSRVMEPAEQGDYRLVLATTAAMAIAVDWVGAAVLRFYPSYERDDRLDEFCRSAVTAAFGAIALACLLVGGGVLALSASLRPELRSLLWLGIGSFALGTMHTTLAVLLRARRDLGWYGLLCSLESLGKLALGLAIAWLISAGGRGMLLGACAIYLFLLPLAWRRAWQGTREAFRPGLATLRPMAAYGLPLTLGGLCVWALNFGDRYLVNHFDTTEAVGIYSSAYGIADNTIILVTFILMRAGNPLLMRVWETDGPEAARSLLGTLTRYTLATCVPAAVLLAVLARPVVEGLLDAPYWEGYPVVPVVAAASLLRGLQDRFQIGLHLVRRNTPLTVVLVIASLLNIGLNVVLIPRMGYMGAAYATLAAFGAQLGLTAAVSSRLMPWRFPWLSLLRVALASAPMGGLAYWMGATMPGPALVRAAIAAAAGVPVFLLGLAATGEIGRREFQWVASRLGPKRPEEPPPTGDAS